MATNYYYLKGKVKYFKAVVPDKFGKWGHVLYFTDESLEEVKKLKEGTPGKEGLKNYLRKDEDGYHMTFSRPTQKTYKGKTQGFAPPKVVDKDELPLPMGIMVGNGSDVTTKIAVYDYPLEGGRKGTAARWESTRVDNLIPFIPERDYDKDDALAVKGFDKVPPNPAF